MALGNLLRSIQLLNLNEMCGVREQAQELKILMGYLIAGQFECGEIMVAKHIRKQN